jgi:hypothetical protein
LPRKGARNAPGQSALLYRAAVLTRDVRFEGWTVQDWLRLLSLFEGPSPGAGGQAGRQAGEQGGLVVVHDGARALKLLHTRVGRLDAAGERWPQPLAELAGRHRAAWAVALHVGALEEIMERFGSRAQQGDDIATQLLEIAQIVRDMALEGALDGWPRSPRQLPLPGQTVLARTLDSVCPAGKVVAVGLFERGELWTCVALRRSATRPPVAFPAPGAPARAQQSAGFDLVMGPDEIRGAMGLLSGDWRRDYRHLAAAIEDRVGPLGAGLFSEVERVRALTTEGAPGGWARAAAVRDIIVSPMSAAVAVPLLLDAAPGAASAAREAAVRFDPTGRVAPALKAIGEQAQRHGLHEALRAWLTRGNSDTP